MLASKQQKNKKVKKTDDKKQSSLKTQDKPNTTELTVNEKPKRGRKPKQTKSIVAKKNQTAVSQQSSVDESLSMEELAKLLQIPSSPTDTYIPYHLIAPKKTNKNRFILKLLLIVMSLGILISTLTKFGYLFTPDEDEKIHIVMAFNGKYEIGAGVAIYSILKNADYQDWYSFHILSANISDDFKEKIETLKSQKRFDIEYIDMPTYLGKNALNTEQNPTFYRYYLPDLLPNINKVLWLDADVLVYRSLRPLYQTNIQKYYVAGVEDANSCNYASLIDMEKIFNAGILLFNLDKMRQDGMMKTVLKTDWDLENAGKRKQYDQTVLNVAFKDNIKWLPPKYNFFHHSLLTNNIHSQYNMMCNSFKSDEITQNWKDIVIMHYVYAKPWLIGPKFSNWIDFFRYLAESPWNGYWVQSKKEEGELLIKLANGKYVFYKNPRVLCDITERDKNMYVFCGDNKLRKYNKLFFEGIFFLSTISR